MRRSIPVLAISLAAALVAAAPSRSAEELVDGIAAQVGSEVVLVSEVARMVEPLEARLREMNATPQDVARLRAEALDRLIEWRLIEKVVRQAELFATEAEIDETIATIAQQNEISKDQLRESVEAHGLTYDEYRAQLKRELERRKVLKATIGSQVRVDEEEVRKRYDLRYAGQPRGGVEVHLRQILITHGGETGRDEATACALVAKGLGRIRGGEPFEIVAADLSEVAPEDGGDIGWLLEKSLAPWMSELVKTLEPGQTTDVAALPFGCSALHLVARREYEPVSFEQARPALQEEIYQEVATQKYTEWLETLRANTYIERRGHFADAAKLGESTFFGAADPLELPPVP